MQTEAIWLQSGIMCWLQTGVVWPILGIFLEEGDGEQEERGSSFNMTCQI